MKKSGFSLVELSIVLIVIGLLVATVSGSSKLIANSKLRKVIQETESLKSAINTFFASYEAYPGDFSNATAFFSDVTDGDSDNLVEYSSENSYAWLHMQKAEVIDGNYNGLMLDGGNGSEAGVNSLASQYHSSACFNFVGGLGIGSDMGIITGMNNITLGTRWYDNACVGSILIPRNAEFLDLKLDDGSPVKGSIRSVGGQIDPSTSVSSGSANYSTECLLSDEYNTLDGDEECILTFLF